MTANVGLLGAGCTLWGDGLTGFGERAPGPVWGEGVSATVRVQGPSGERCVTSGKFLNLSVPSCPHL